MSCISYNCRGLGNPRAVGRLKKLLSRERPDVIFLMETKLGSVEMNIIKNKLQFQNGYHVDAMGRSGGLSLMWMDNVDVSIMSASAHYVDCMVKGLFTNDAWRLTRFYGWSDHSQKHLSWELLRSLKSASPHPWLVVGDFNQILFDIEKKGGPLRSQREMNEFREALDDCNLQDLGYTGDAFTWWNMQADPMAVFERLDRGVATLEWVTLLPHVSVSHLPRDRSDHKPLRISDLPLGGGRKKFRFEDMWLSSPGCEQVIKDAWQASDSLENAADILEKIKKM